MKVTSKPCSTNSTCNSCFEKRPHLLKNYTIGLKVTALVLSLIILIIAVIAVISSTGMLSESSALYTLSQMGKIGSSILMVTASISTLIFSVLMSLSCSKPQASEKKILGKFPNHAAFVQEDYLGVPASLQPPKPNSINKNIHKGEDWEQIMRAEISLAKDPNNNNNLRELQN